MITLEMDFIFRFIKKLLRCLHPLNRINISFEFYDSRKTGARNDTLSAGDGHDRKTLQDALPEEWSFDVFDAQTKAMIDKGRRNENAKLNVIRLDRLEEHYGPQWEKVLGSVHAVVQKILKKSLTEDEAFTQIKNNGYIVLLADESDLVAKSRTQKLSREIHVTFLGEEAEDRQDGETGGQDPGVGGRVSRKKSGDTGHQSHPASALENGQTAPRSGTDVPLSIINPEGAGRTSVQTSLPPEGHRESAGGKEVFDLSGAETLPPGIEIRLRPLADAQTGAISGFVCTPFYGGTEGYAILKSAKNRNLYSEIDQLTLASVQNHMAAMIQGGKKSLFICPVHINSIDDPTNNTFLVQSCAKLKPEEKQYLHFELNDNPAKPLGDSAMKEIAGKLKPHCKAIILKMDIFAAVRKNLGQTAIKFISVNAHESTLPDYALGAPLQKLAAEAKKASMRLMAHGLNSETLVQTARDAGYAFVDGDAVHACISTPADAKNTMPVV